MKKWLPLGGGFKTTVVAFLFMFDFSTFPGWLEQMAESWRSEKSPLGKSWSGRVRSHVVCSTGIRGDLHRNRESRLEFG